MSTTPLIEAEAPAAAGAYAAVLPLVSAASPAPTAAKPLAGPAIVSLEEAPKWTRVAFIAQGYRVRHSYSSTLLSLFTLHSDTFNVWSHVAGFAYFACSAPAVFAALARHGAPPQDVAFFAVSIACSLLQMGSSALYHLFRCVSLEDETRWLRVDIFGILAQIFGAFLLFLTQAFRCSLPALASYMAVELLLLAVFVHYGQLYNQPGQYTAYQVRYYSAAVLAVGFGLVPGAHALATAASAELLHIGAATLFGALGAYAVGLAFMVARVPERLASGQLTSVLNSHGVWHLFVWLAGAITLQGLLAFNGAFMREGACPLKT